jgi:origin recognition complex subunit 5
MKYSRAQIKNLSVVFIITIPNPRLFHLQGTPHIHFPPYTKDESIQILSVEPPRIFTKPVDSSYNYGDEEEAEDRDWLWPRYCTAVWDSLGKAVARDLRSFKSICHKIWPYFIQPIRDGQFGTRDFSKLLVAKKNLFQSESILTGTGPIQQQTSQQKVTTKRLGKFQPRYLVN